MDLFGITNDPMTSLSEVLQSQIRISQGKTEELRYGVLFSEGYCYG